jgi:hypothetical protein
MKKIIFSAIILIILFLSIETKAVCPNNWSGPYVVRIQLGENCWIEADWCCGTQVTIFLDTINTIHFSNIRIIGNCTNYITWAIDQNQNYIPTIPWGDLIYAIIISQTACFHGQPDIRYCTELPDPGDFYIKVTNGGCYNHVYYMDQDFNEVNEYVPCDANQVSFCYERIRLCWQFVAPNWKIKAEGDGVEYTFECTGEGSFRMCTP